MNKDEIWDKIVEYGFATDEELNLVTAINGYSVETLNDVIYARTGYHDWNQMAEAEGIEEMFDED